MESIKKPYCSRKSLIEALGHFSPDNPTEPIPPDSDDEGPSIRGNDEDLDLVKQLVNPRGEPDSPKDAIEEEAKENGEERHHQVHPTTSDDGVNVENSENTTGMDGSKENEAPPSDGNGKEGEEVAVRRDSTFQGALERHSMTMSKCAVRYGGASLDAENAGNSEESSTVVDAAQGWCEAKRITREWSDHLQKALPTLKYQSLQRKRLKTMAASRQQKSVPQPA